MILQCADIFKAACCLKVFKKLLCSQPIHERCFYFCGIHYEMLLLSNCTFIVDATKSGMCHGECTEK